MSDIGQLAILRQNDFLKKHGKHEWEKHDLFREAEEELADTWNYIVAKRALMPGKEELFAETLEALKIVWLELENLKGKANVNK